MNFKIKNQVINVTKNRHFMHVMVFILCCALCTAMLPLAPSTKAAEEPCAAVFKNGEFLFAVSTEYAATRVLNRYCSDFFGNDPTFADVVTVEPVQAKKHMILSEEEAYTLLKEENHLPVITTIVSRVNKKIPREVEEVADDTIYVGDRKIVCEGKDGVQTRVVCMYYKNGVKYSRKVQEVILSEAAVKQIIHVGTKPRPSDVGTGVMVNPCTGRFESPFGARWGRQHKGIDISNVTDTPIYAADNGKVVYADYMSGYGQLIQVDHNNGLVTYYAHLNTMHVQVGDVVEKGAVIGGMGATGNVTGTHLHFEVRQNGVPIDPLSYVSY